MPSFIVKRKHHLRFVMTMGILFMLLLFIVTLVQFSQIERTDLTDRRDKIIDDNNNNKNNQLGQNSDKLKRLNRLRNKVANKFPFRFYRERNEMLYDEGLFDEEKAKEVTKTLSKMQRLVHLDLKGSPLKLNYLKELIPFIKNAGATGVLIEYEDFFPYENDLESISNQNHYTSQELSQLFALLKESQLTLIPLVQMYGHLEFVLKLKQFAYLRESSKHFQVISPCLNDTYEKVLFRMLDQIIESHPETLEYIHIGCDEVFHVNVNDACKSLELKSVQDYFIYHVTKIVNYIKSKRSSLNVIIWDDMIRRNMDKNDQLTDFAKKIVPMVWDYNEINKIDKKIWKSYEELFNEIWIASAFKGATNQLELIPNAEKHYQNQLAWINTINELDNPQKIKGIALTGWSRYDHMQAVCEIMPSGIPSLALCLQAIVNFDKEDDIIFSKTRDLVKCNYNNSTVGFVLNPASLISEPIHKDLKKLIDLYECSFPGSNIYKWILNLKFIIQYFDTKHTAYSNILNKYNLKNNFFNTMIYDKAVNKFYPKMKNEFIQMKTSGEKEFDKYFYGDLYEEITYVYINRYIDIIDSKLDELNKTRLPEHAPVRPFNKISQSLL